MRDLYSQYERSTDEEIGRPVDRLNSLQTVTKNQRQPYAKGNSFISTTQPPLTLYSNRQTDNPPTEKPFEPIQKTEGPPTSNSTEIIQSAKEEMEIAKVQQVVSTATKVQSLFHIATRRPANVNMYYKSSVLIRHPKPSSKVIVQSPTFPPVQFQRSEGEDVTFTSQGT